jgi:lysine 2,3-aminomutase
MTARTKAKAQSRQAPDPVEQRVAARYAIKVTDHVHSTIKGNVKTDPVAMQYLPQIEELVIRPGERADPIGDDAHTPVKGIVHRYPDRALLKLSGVCAVYCRYCFRKEMIGPDVGILSADEQTRALDYIRGNTQIREVILTGGDPLVLSPRRLSAVMEALDAIEHVEILRLHTRVPVADPARITPDLVKALRCEKPVYVVIHINHAQEITPAVRGALRILHEAGCVLLSQSVLLKNVNDDAAVLEALFRALVALRVKPYYLHHPDMTPGTGHFRVSLEKGQEIMKALRGRVSGLCQPTYMLDIPGGFGKVPVGPTYIETIGPHSYQVEDYKGCRHFYAAGEST